METGVRLMREVPQIHELGPIGRQDTTEEAPSPNCYVYWTWASANWRRAYTALTKLHMSGRAPEQSRLRLQLPRNRRGSVK
jgi:hypothetical protein